MEFVRLKYANNKLINANIQEHREVIADYVEKKGFEYLGFIPTSFSPSGKILEIDLIFRKPVQKVIKPVRRVAERPAQLAKSTPQPQPQKPARQEVAKDSSRKDSANDLYNDRGLDLILSGGDLLDI